MQKNDFFTKPLWALFLILMGFCTSCDEQDGKPVEMPMKDFTTTLDSLSTQRVGVQDLQRIKQQYGRFFDIWFSEIMDYSKFRGYPDSIIAQRFSYWVQTNKQVFLWIKEHYEKNTSWRTDLNTMWGKLSYRLPKTPQPTIVSYFSQFSNFNTFVDSSKSQGLILGFSKEMFMNDTFPLYAMLDVPGFYNRYNNTEQIPTMLIWNYLKSQYESKHNPKNMLEQAVFEGKIWALILDMQDGNDGFINLGYTEEEWAMMERDQGQMWKLFLEQKALYSNDFNVYRRYFVYGDKTFGPGIPPECPPMIGSFVGTKIVQRYLQEVDVTWEELFDEHDANKILRLSGYNPVK